MIDGLRIMLKVQNLRAKNSIDEKIDFNGFVNLINGLDETVTVKCLSNSVHSLAWHSQNKSPSSILKIVEESYDPNNQHQFFNGRHLAYKKDGGERHYIYLKTGDKADVSGSGIEEFTVAEIQLEYYI